MKTGKVHTKNLKKKKTKTKTTERERVKGGGGEIIRLNNQVVRAG